MKKYAISIMAVGLLLAGAVQGCRDEGGADGLESYQILIDWQAEPTYLGVYFAKHLGLFEELGLDVEIVQSRGANQAVTAVAAGQYPVGTASGGATVLGYNNDADVVSLGVIYQRVPSVVYGLASSGIKDASDLKGKRIGIYPGSITKNEFDAYMKLNGLTADDLEIESLSGADIPLLKSGQLDGVLHYAEMSPVVVSLDPELPEVDGSRIYELGLADGGVGGYGLNVITSRESLAEDRDRILAVFGAIAEGYRRGCEDPEAAVAAFLAAVPQKDEAYVESSWSRVCEMAEQPVGEQTVEGWEATIALYQSLGLLSVSVTPEQLMP
jgi:ABC-type nitrate/sulfonate/bicarbonate transport system substrate-binding protein